MSSSRKRNRSPVPKPVTEHNWSSSSQDGDGPAKKRKFDIPPVGSVSPVQTFFTAREHPDEPLSPSYAARLEDKADSGPVDSDDGLEDKANSGLVNSDDGSGSMDKNQDDSEHKADTDIQEVDTPTTHANQATTVPTTHVEDTRGYRVNLRNTCKQSLDKLKCRSTANCYGPSGLFHVCDEFTKGFFNQGGLGAVHNGGLHRARRWSKRASEDCGRPGCYDPTGAQLIHVRYNCFSFRVGQPCLTGGAITEGGSCDQGHDNADIRQGTSNSHVHGREVIPEA